MTCQHVPPSKKSGLAQGPWHFTAQWLHYSSATRETWALCPFHQAEVEPPSPSSPKSALTTYPSRGCSGYQASRSRFYSLLWVKGGGAGNLKNIQQKKRAGWQGGLWTSKLTAQHNMDLDDSGGKTRSWWLRGTWLIGMQMAQEFRQSEGEEDRAREFWGLVLVMG